MKSPDTSIKRGEEIYGPNPVTMKSPDTIIKRGEEIYGPSPVTLKDSYKERTTHDLGKNTYKEERRNWPGDVKQRGL